MRPAAQPSPRPRIAYLITNSEIGGAQSHVADLLQSMAGKADTVLLAGGDGPLFDIAKRADAQAIRLALLDNALSPLRAIAALRELVNALKAASPDLIHAHSAKAGALGRIAGFLLGMPVVYTVHGFAFKPEAPVRQRLAARVAEWILAPLTARVICVAEAELRLARSLPVPAERITVIPNGIADTAHRASPQAPLRKIVMVARFAAPKRPDAAIRAFARAGLEACELVLAGDGPQRAAMQQLAQQLAPGRVQFPGNVTDIPALLASAQAFVLASDHEGFPLSVLEAMRAGLPVVASDLPGIREQLENNRHGVLVDHDDENAFSAALHRLAGDGALRAALGSEARRRWEQSYGLERMTEATWSVYRDALAQTPRAARVPT
ncbi:glycosyltransferase family 1 protein [Cupriavidus necator]|uniref:Glycosyltransferase family 1 protein n=1 Tax=Cupriavidus necator TaxID=106590 RepID=A0A1U9USP0_CUPNE|nr:glycosyltransferase family 4 protein [Cupriavidus necator]AQV95281.1 glycosyltransferase family 1 protein [Cupriavidus necator]